MKTHYEKTCLTYRQHLHLLKEHGLVIPDELKAEGYLMNIGYFRLNAYFYPLLEIPKEKLVFKKGATFKQVLDLYRFDRKLRILLFNEIEKIEIAIRSQVTNLAGLQFDNLFWLTDKNNFVDKNKFEGILSIIEKEVKNSREDFISHFKKTYLEPYPPAWMIMEILPLGSLFHIYMSLKDPSLKKRIAQYFGLQTPVFTSWLVILGALRNLCCHHARLWNRELPVIPSEPKRTQHPWITPFHTDKRRIYYRICMIRYLLFTISPQNTFEQKLEKLLAAYPSVDLRAMGFPDNWKEEKLWR